MNRYHQEILGEIEKEARRNPFNYSHSKDYDGHNDLTYPLNNPQRRKITRNWIKAHPDISSAEFLRLLNSLYGAKSSDEKSIAGMLLGYFSKLKREIDPAKLDNWLDYLEGWAQVDSLCQSNFSADDLLSNWKNWEKLIRGFAQDKNINKKRAALVLLTKPVRDSSNPKLAGLAFKTIEKLKREKEVLITKAISWLLRDLIKNHRSQVESYLEKNLDTLPKIVIRETKRKLLTGKK